MWGLLEGDSLPFRVLIGVWGMKQGIGYLSMTFFGTHAGAGGGSWLAPAC